MSSLIVYQGKMTAGTYMENENLYIVFPSGIKDGALAYVLGTWTKDASGTENSPLTMIGYPLKLITETAFYIVRNGKYYHLKVEISGDKLNVVLLNERDEESSSKSTLRTPDLLLALTNSHTISGSYPPISPDLSPVPALPDERFPFHAYNTAFPTQKRSPSSRQTGTSRSRNTPSTPQLQLPVPLTLRALLSITDNGGAFEPSFTPRASSLEDVVSWLQCVQRRKWMYRLRGRTLRWFLAPSSAIPGTRPASAPGRAVTLRVTVLNIDQLMLSGETYKPYKGVRGRALRRVEWGAGWKGGYLNGSLEEKEPERTPPQCVMTWIQE
ncbi:hypothetical protein EDB85DRAFT_2145707 [Lactarius pseudohatsudake]|nr:hypothetical protein EDB85DRAFT_2145707 [Lactarius pseudohatsudake]